MTFKIEILISNEDANTLLKKHGWSYNSADGWVDMATDPRDRRGYSKISALNILAEKLIMETIA